MSMTVVGNEGPHAKPTTRLAVLIAVPVLFFALQLFVTGDDGFFAVTVERIESPWLTWTFLNLPLQLGLSVVAALLAASPRTRPAAWWVAGLGALLVVGHVVLSIATA